MVKNESGTTKGMRLFNPKTHKTVRKSSKGKAKGGMGGGF